MKFYDALEVMKRGEAVEHGGKIYKLMPHGIHDVTNPESPARVLMVPKEWDAADTDTPEVVAPEKVDEVLAEGEGQ